MRARVGMAAAAVLVVAACLWYLPAPLAAGVGMVAATIYLAFGSRVGGQGPGWAAFTVTGVLDAACAVYVAVTRGWVWEVALYATPAVACLVVGELFRRPPFGHPSRRQLPESVPTERAGR